MRHILCDIAQLLTSACQIGGLLEEGGVECQWQQFAGAPLNEVYPFGTIEQLSAGVGECFHYRIFIAAKIGKTFRIRAVKRRFCHSAQSEGSLF